MIKLRKMKQIEFPGFREYFIKDYGREIAENYGYPINSALNIAEKDLNESFSEGPETKDQELLCIILHDSRENILVGYLWYQIDDTSQSAFINDFYIFEQQRSQGYGKLSIAALEKKLTDSGIKQLKLRVAYQNKRALALYKEIGFIITGYNMYKNLS